MAGARSHQPAGTSPVTSENSINEFATLQMQDLETIHEHLVAEFESSGDPIEPPGIKNRDLLESAVSRQFVGLGGSLKYSTPVANAATLCYGVCSNHPFHNGNKRTALVALLCHLDKNSITFSADTDQDKLYSFMLKVASHRFAPRRQARDSSDAEVSAMETWIRKRTRKVRFDERIVTFRELRGILRQHGFDFANPRNNYIDVIGTRTKRIGLFRRQTHEEQYRVLRIPYPGEGKDVGKNLLRRIRQLCELTEKHGVDSEIFYVKERPVDAFVTRYRKTLRRLAKT